MTNFGALKVGAYFSIFNSWHIFKKYSEDFAISSNGELVAFSPSQVVLMIG